MNLAVSVIIAYLELITSHSSDAFDDDDSTMDDDTDYYYSNNYEDFHLNVTNCTNDYCISDEDYIGLMMDHIFPKLSDWVLIGMHSIVFVVGLIGNALVCMAVYRNHSMRTVTNYFIVNLAVADLLVLLICLPPSVVWDVTETWFLGLNLCKAVPYLQTVSVSVSVLTLTFISLDRWYAICFPFHQRFKSTTNRAKFAIIMIWVFSLIFDFPELLVLHTVPSQSRVQTVLFTQCVWSWSQESQTTFTIVKLMLLYTLPLLFMSVAYWRIVQVLWKSNIPGHNPVSTRISHSTEMPLSGGGNPEGQLKSRRKAAKMLVAVVVTFAICFFPVHLLSILRCTMDLPADQWTIAVSLIAHWLCYFNSAVNPLIYNFMSGKFRKEFRRAFQCPPNSKTSTHHGFFSSVSNPLNQRSRRTRSVNTTSINNNVQTTEFIPISGIQQVEKHK